MTTFLTSLLEHPVLFTVLVIGILVFIGQTYDFILTMFGRKPSEELNDEEKKIFNQMKNAMKDKKDNKNKQEYIYDDNIKGVYE